MTAGAQDQAVAKRDLTVALRSLWGGFVTPTPFAFITMLASFLVFGVLFLTLVTPELLAGPMGAYLPRSARDNEAFATREALSLEMEAPELNPPPRLYVISDSVLAHAFASEARTAEVLQDRTSRPWRVAFLTTPLQGPLDEAALSDYATTRQAGVVVLSLSFQRLGDRPDDLIALYRMERLGLRSAWADDEIERVGGKRARFTGVYAIDNADFLIRNAAVMGIRMISRQAAVRQVAAYLPDRPLRSSALAERRAIILKRLRAVARTDDAGVRLLAETVRRLKARGAQIVFVEEPVSEALFEGASDRARYQAYLTSSAAMARSLGGYYCRPSSRYQPTAAEFPDYIHVAGDAAQARLREALAMCISAATDAGKAAP